MRNYNLTDDQRNQFQSMYLLWRMSGDIGGFPLILPGELAVLTPLLDSLMVKGLVRLTSAGYILTTEGEECLAKFRVRYQDYLQMYDVYCAVDLEKGIFAFSEILTMSTDAFRMYLQHPAWEDLRVAVASYKGLDPLEIVFMSFLNEGRFSKSGTGWAFELLGGMLWDELLKICNTMLHADDLGTNDVIEDIINMGSQLMSDILQKNQEDLNAQVTATQPGTAEVVTTTETVTYVEEVVTYQTVPSYGYRYGGYYDVGYVYDPFYVSPCWGDPYWYW